jgi:hypothetical protein
VGAGGQSWWLAQWSTNTVNGSPFHEYNNYVIFKQSFVHLIAQEDLYRAWPSEHWDLYKYTPTFALFFGIFGAFPDLWGLIGWNLLNAGVLAAGVTALGALSQREQALGLLFLWPELLISLQNEQSNALIAGCAVFLSSSLVSWHWRCFPFTGNGPQVCFCRSESRSSWAFFRHLFYQ